MRYIDRSFIAVILVTAFIVIGPAEAASPVAVDQPGAAPAEIIAVVEIPAGSFTKYELDPATGHLVVDRFQSMPVVYPANYGFVPSSAAADGDPLDVLIITREPVVPGALIRIRPVGVLRMIDGGEGDDKIIAVPAEAVDPHYAGILDIDDLAPIERQRIEAFFRRYKELPAGRKLVELRGFGDVDEAREMISRALDAFSGK